MEKAAGTHGVGAPRIQLSRHGAAPVGMKIILIDTSKTFMTATRQALAAALPDIEATEYDAEQQGLPAADFRWALYDAALISQELGHAATGLEWLRRYRAAPGFPPAVLCAATGDEYLAVAAVRAGAHDYVRRADVPGARFTQIIAALDASRRAQPDATLRLDTRLRQALDCAATPGAAPADGNGHRCVRLIGQGGFSRVYLAERATDGAAVVLKIIDTHQVHEPVVVQRFVREAELIAGIDNPYVVKVYDQGFTPDYGYISMEFFQRGDLKRRLENGIELRAAIQCMRAIAKGLQAIHARDVIHRDLKPGNIMFRADDSLALADFGISKRLHDSRDLTAQSGVVGTPSYLSPEQARGAPVDPRSDLYSAGVIFFELLTGRKPFRSESAAGLVYQHLHTPAPRLPAELAPLQPMMDMLLAKNPAERFSSADEFLQSLDHWLPPTFRDSDRSVRLAA
jgi:tRNA A-37 threonylcarbamoyl transferase component Bud32/DNA-binding NarL/FixJ family response regulator